MPITDDASMDAALYGSSHVATLLSREDAGRIAGILDDRSADALCGLDPDLAHFVMHKAPELVYSDECPDPTVYPQEIIDTVVGLRTFIRAHLGSRLVRQWDEGVDDRGRLIGLGEHSARRASSGLSETDYKMAVLKRVGRLP